ncbi:MAG: hypothetical protein OEU86_02760 [Gammaproteobacteria bacterium]|nr:hypothetical protein [Gammaproteobacteria bacterium]
MKRPFKTTGIILLTFMLSAVVGLQLYTSWPSSAVSESLNIPADTRYLVIILHGTGGRDEPTLIKVTERFTELTKNMPHTQVLQYIWSPWSDGALRAGIHGRKIGRELGQQLTQFKALEDVRLIATSAGSYLLEPLCNTYKEDNGPAKIEMTFLDSMGIRGGWDYWYGYRHYGECADYAASLFNSDDGVPGTNAPLHQAYNFDLTQAPSKKSFNGNGHLWPVQYFLDHLNAKEVTPGTRLHTHNPRGAVISSTSAPANERP